MGSGGGTTIQPIDPRGICVDRFISNEAPNRILVLHRLGLCFALAAPELEVSSHALVHLDASHRDRVSNSVELPR